MNADQNATPAQPPIAAESDRRSTIGVGCVSLILGVLVLVVAIPTRIGPLGSDATMLAMIGAGGLAVFGATLALGGFQARSAKVDRPNDDGAPGDVGPRDSGKRQAIGVTLVALVYAWGLGWVGFLPASYVCLTALLLLLGVRSVFVILLLPALVVSVVYLGIDVALGAHLPDGRIEWGGLLRSDAGGGT